MQMELEKNISFIHAQRPIYAQVFHFLKFNYILHFTSNNITNCWTKVQRLLMDRTWPPAGNIYGKHSLKKFAGVYIFWKIIPIPPFWKLLLFSHKLYKYVGCGRNKIF